MAFPGGDTISVCLPARNEAETIGEIVREAVKVEMVDEVVVIDDGSTDDTALVAADAGARVVAERDILPGTGPGSGKGNVLWKSLYECTGDVIAWIDADLRNFRGEYIERLCEPFADRAVSMVKATYVRAFEGAPTGGGRVNTLVARPLLSLLFPELAWVAQPLAGEYAVRRGAVEGLSFVQGWGVEIALLIDLGAHGGNAVVEVDLGMREHRNRPLDELAAPAEEIIATALQRAGHLDASAVRERPPMLSVPEYRARCGPPR